MRNYYAYLWETQKSVSPVSITEELPHTLSMEILLFLNRTILEKVSLFKNANEIFIREIVQLLRPMVFLPDDYIIRQGEYGDCMYFLSNGDVEVLVTARQRGAASARARRSARPPSSRGRSAWRASARSPTATCTSCQRRISTPCAAAIPTSTPR